MCGVYFVFGFLVFVLGKYFDYIIVGVGFVGFVMVNCFLEDFKVMVVVVELGSDEWDNVFILDIVVWNGVYGIYVDWNYISVF